MVHLMSARCRLASFRNPNLLLAIAAILFQPACTVCLYGTKRIQDMRARRIMQTLIYKQTGYQQRNGHYARTLGELRLPKDMALPFRESNGCDQGYCYLLEISGSG